MTTSSDSVSNKQDSVVDSYQVNMSATKITKQKDCLVKKGSTSGFLRYSDQAAVWSSSEDEHLSKGLHSQGAPVGQLKIRCYGR